MDISDILFIVWLMLLMGVLLMAVFSRRRMRAASKELTDQLTQMAAAAAAASSSFTIAGSSFTVAGNFAVAPISGPGIFFGSYSYELDPEPADTFWTPEPILAWRHFRVRSGLPYLDSMTRGVYPPNAPAICQGGTLGMVGNPHESPSWQCTCGYYAFKNLPHPWGEDVRELFSDGDVVFAAVHLSGHVIEHEKGYRAQYIKPIAVTTQSAALMHMSGLSHLLTTTNPDHPIITDHIAAVYHEHDKRKESNGHR